MAPIVKRTDKEDRLLATFAFARRLAASLETGSKVFLPSADLYKAIDRVTSLSKLSTVNARADLDKLGTSTWNQVSKRKDIASGDGEYACLVRVFSCLLIECAQRSVSGSTSSMSFCDEVLDITEKSKDDVRVLKCTIKASKYCLDLGYLNLGEIAVEKAAFYEERLKRNLRADDDTTSALSCEYYVLRIVLAWRQGRLDLAKLMLAKISLTSEILNPFSAEQLADSLFEIGKSQLKQNCHEEAMYWLGKAHDALSIHDIGSMSIDASDLKVSTLHSTVRALMHLEGEANNTKAWSIIHDLEMDQGERLAVCLLKLDLYAAERDPHPQEYSAALERIINTVHLSETNNKTILHHVHLLRSWAPSLAHDVLAMYICKRLLDTEHYAWTEKTLVVYVWIVTTSAELEDPIGSLKRLLDEATAGAATLSPSATHAAQILLWKSIESCYQQQQYYLAEAWCKLALHKIFDKSGSTNVEKLQRKLMICALSQAESVKAREVYNQMSPTSQKEPATLYLLYKIAIRCQDIDMATECLDSICKATTKDATILYACVLEAQKTGDHGQSIAALQRVLQKYNYGAPDGVHLPALLRCTARLLMKQNDKERSPSVEVLENICQLFEGAATQARRARQDTDTSLFTTNELDWFSRNSYNIALKNCIIWDHRYIIRMIASCTTFIDLYPNDLDINTVDDLSLRKSFCFFLSTSLLTVMARQEDFLEAQLQHYRDARRAVQSFRSVALPQMEKLGGGAKQDLQRKYTSLLAYDFEAAARLKEWDDFPSILKDCQSHGDAALFANLASIVLASEAPTDTTIATLQQIINATWDQGGNDIAKLSRWIRCLFSLAVIHSTAIAEQLLEQAISIIERAQGSSSNAYPAEELEWLAAATFNHAVDFYGSSQDADCRRWAEQALRLSSMAGDGGALHELLQEKYQNLAWDER